MHTKGLNHEFGVMSVAKRDYADKASWGYRSVLEVMENRVDIHDDLLRYLSDSLQWIQSFNPHTQKLSHGLNFYGDTVITTENAARAAQIIECWATLFSFAPDEDMRLTGAFVWEEGEQKSGHYLMLEVSRDRVVALLRELAAALTRVAASDGNEYFVHLGI